MTCFQAADLSVSDSKFFVDDVVHVAFHTTKYTDNQQKYRPNLNWSDGFSVTRS